MASAVDKLMGGLGLDKLLGGGDLPKEKPTHTAPVLDEEARRRAQRAAVGSGRGYASTMLSSKEESKLG
jgi:hypothetical protein